MLNYFISGFLLCISLCLDLGTVNIALIRMGLRKGFLPSLVLGIGASFGDLLFAVISLFGISLILKYILVRWALWIFGTLFLAYLSIKMFKEYVRPHEIDLLDNANTTGTTQSLGKIFIEGFGLALSSPSSILWFATVGGSIIAAQGVSDSMEILSFFSGFFSASILWSILFGYLSGMGGKYFNKKILRVISLISALLFVYFAVKVFLNGYEEFIMSKK